MVRARALWSCILAVIVSGLVGSSPTAAADYGADGFRWTEQLPGLTVTEIELVMPDDVHRNEVVQYVEQLDMMVVASARDVTIFDVSTFDLIHEFNAPQSVIGLDVSDDGTRLALLGITRVAVYDTTSWSLLWTTPEGDAQAHVAFAPGQSNALVVTGRPSWIVGPSGTIDQELPAAPPAPDGTGFFWTWVWGDDASTVIGLSDEQIYEYAVDDVSAPVRQIANPRPSLHYETDAQRPLHRVGDRVFSDAGFELDPASLRVVDTYDTSSVVWGRDDGDVVIRQTGRKVDIERPGGPDLGFELPSPIGDDPAFFMVPLTGTEFAYIDVGNHLAFGDATFLSSHYGDFTPVTPNRVLDTRVPIGQPSAKPLAGGEQRKVAINGTRGVPADGVSAVVVNVTAVGASAPTYLSTWASGTPRPTVSNLNVDATVARPGVAIANLATVPVGLDGKISVFNGAGSVDVLIDVVGFYSALDGPAGSRYFGLAGPRRVADTRDPPGVFEKPLGDRLGADETRRLNLREYLAPSAGASAALLQITAIDPDAPSFITVYPGDVERPDASNLNLIPGRVTPNLTMVRVPPSGIVEIYNLAGGVDLAVDLIGFFELRDTDHPDIGGRFFPVTPDRILDTREWSPFPAPGSIDPDSAIVFDDPDAVEADTRYFVLNVTAVLPTEPGFLSVVQPDTHVTTSNVNFGPGDVRSGHVYTPTSHFMIYNSHGDTHVVVDVFGEFTEVFPATSDRYRD